ncbi:hypothetical protein HDR63_03845 [bacterium]|nr:hypothetical protein [bacterium]
MRLDKKLLNNLSKKYTMLALAAASVLGACSKDDGPAIEQHDTTYTFAPHDRTQLQDLAQIKRSADSAAVRYIYFRATSGNYDANAWEGVNLNGLIKTIDPAFQAAKKKGRAAGTIDRAWDDPNMADAIQKLQDYGYKLNLIEVPEYAR